MRIAWKLYCWQLSIDDANFVWPFKICKFLLAQNNENENEAMPLTLLFVDQCSLLQKKTTTTTKIYFSWRKLLNGAVMNLDGVFWSGKFRVNAQKLCKQFVFFNEFFDGNFCSTNIERKVKNRERESFCGKLYNVKGALNKKN